VIPIHSPAEEAPMLGRPRRLGVRTCECAALTGGELKEILTLVPGGTPVEIVS